MGSLCTSALNFFVQERSGLERRAQLHAIDAEPRYALVQIYDILMLMVQVRRAGHHRISPESTVAFRTKYTKKHDVIATNGIFCKQSDTR